MPLMTRSQVSSQAQGWTLVSKMRKWGDLRASFQHSALEGVEGACWASGIRLGRGQAIYSLASCTKWVSSPLGTHWVLGPTTGNTTSLDSPRPGLGGNHHLPPYSVLCVTPRRLHPNGFLSQDSQSGVSKLSRFGLPGLWTVIASRPNLWSGRGLNQYCSSHRELSNAVSYSPSARQERVNSWLLVVGSQIASLTLGPSFTHNLGCRCPIDSCEAILDIYTSRTFQRYKEHLNARCFDPWNRLLSFRESQRTPNSHFRECEWRPQISFKVGFRVCHCIFWVWWGIFLSHVAFGNWTNWYKNIWFSIVNEY